jgi:CubicO group peptidase (beta-lactamase class C family)
MPGPRCASILALLTLAVAGGCGAVPVDAEATPAQIAHAAFATRVRNDDIPGLSAAVAVQGRVEWSEAFGEADRARRSSATCPGSCTRAAASPRGSSAAT